MSGVTPFWDWARQSAHISNDYVKSGIAEFFGTFVLCLFAVGAGAQATLIGGDSYVVPTLGGCLGVMIAVTLFGGVSGAHINPAVTLGLAIAGKVSWIKVPIYWFAQFFGAYLGAGLAYAIYMDDLTTGCPDIGNCPKLDSVFSPPPRGTIAIPFLDQIVGTSILIMVIMSAIDKRNMKVPTFFYGFLFALTILAINIAFGINAGGVLNPARDLGPRLMAVSIGRKSEDVFTAINASGNKVQYWLAPFFGTFVGGAVGSILYVFLIGAQLNDDDDEVSNNRRIPVPPGQPPSQYSQQGPRPDWRNTEVRKLPPVNIGPGSPPPNGPNNNQYY